MRKNKFRVWCIACNKYGCLRHEIGHNLKHGILLTTGELINVDPMGAYTLVHPSSFVLEQFTGLLDKSGKEIYEGDVVKFKDIYNKRKIGEVLFAKGSWCIHYKDVDEITGYNSGFLYTADECGFIEKIGTIHENPELLPDEK